MKEFSATSGAALPTTAAEQFTRLGIRLLVPSLTNRKGFNQDYLDQMAATIKDRGVRQPLIVRPLPGARVPETRLNTPKGQPLPTHEIVCGERRYLASLIAGATDVPVLVRELSDEEALEEQVIENFQRQNFTELEEGEAFQRLMQHNKLTADEVAAKVGCSRRHVFNRIKLLDLRSEARQALLDGQIDAGRALLLARIPDHEQQLKALPIIAKRDYQGEFEMSGRAAADFIQRDFMLSLGSARFKITDETLLPEAGSCKTCTRRTGHNPDLFADVKGADICTDAPCFHRKEEAHNARILQAAHANGQEVITGREAKALMPNSFGGIEGFLRLDDATDSPTDKPLRKLLGNLLEKEDIKPTLVENPHKKGDMIAVLPATKVSELLKQRGHKDAAGALDTKTATDTRRQAEIDKAREQAEKLHTYEQGWRDEVLAQTYTLICAGPHKGQEDLSDEVLRIIALRLASQCNGEQTRQLCELLGLGKIAPREALNDYCRTASQPERTVLLLVMHKDVAFKDFQPDPAAANPGLLQVAADYGVDIEAIKAGVKQAMRAKTSSKVQAPEPSSPALHPKGEGGAKPKASTPARKTKTSAAEASQGIAAAMQGIEASALADAGKREPAHLRNADPKAWPFPGAFAQDTAAAPAFSNGQRVTVAPVGMLRPMVARFTGLPGRITAEADAEGEWEVKLDKAGRGGGVRLFLVHEIEAAA